MSHEALGEQFVAHVKEHGGASINLETGESPRSGYMVSYPDAEITVPTHELGPHHVEKFLTEHAGRVKNARNTYLGGWDDEGTTYLDVSAHIKPENRAKAVQRGEQYGQHAIYEVDKGRVIGTFTPRRDQYQGTLLEPLAKNRKTRMEWDQQQQKAAVYRRRDEMQDEAALKAQRRVPQKKKPKQMKMF